MKKTLSILFLFTTIASYATEITVKYYPKTLLIYRRQEKPFISGPIMVARGKFYLTKKTDNTRGKVFSVSIIKELNTQKFYAKIYQVLEKAIKAKFPNMLTKELALLRLTKGNNQFIKPIEKIADKLKKIIAEYETKISKTKKSENWNTTIEGFDTPSGFKLPKEPKFFKLKLQRLKSIKSNPIMTTLKFKHSEYGDCIIGVNEKTGTSIFNTFCFTEDYPDDERPITTQTFDYKNPKNIYLQYLVDGKPKKIEDPLINDYLRMMIILINTHKDRLIEPGSKIIVKMPIL